MVAPGFELKSDRLWSPVLAVALAPRSACFREDPDSGGRVLALRVPAEDTGALPTTLRALSHRAPLVPNFTAED